MVKTTASEFGKLKRVLMHRPDTDLSIITEKTLGEFNFAGIPDREQYHHDYDLMTAAITARGAEVVLLTDVLKDNAEAMNYIALRPNLIYTRDTAVVTAAGAILMGMKLKSRQGDTWVIRAAFEKLGVPILAELPGGAWQEGGGVSFLDDRTCVASICDRTNFAGSDFFVQQLFKADLIDEMVLVPMSEGTVHIDGSLMVLAPEVALIHREALSLHPARVIRKDGSIRYIPFVSYLTDRGFSLIDLTDQEMADAALNIIVTEPLQGVGYDSGERLFGEVAKLGGGIDSIPRSELLKGCGGPHCMTCPIERV